MTTSIEPLRRRFLEPKFLIPIAIFLWLLVSLPLWLLVSRAEAETFSDPACAGPDQDPTAGVWGQPGHVTVINPCFHVAGTLVYGELWGDDDSRGEGLDEDLNLYMELDDGYKDAVNDTDRRDLQRYEQAQQVADILGETIPQDRDAVPAPCLDSDLREGASAPSNPCNGHDPPVHMDFVGVYVYDNNHGFKEIHPINKESDGNKTCSRVEPCNGVW